MTKYLCDVEGFKGTLNNAIEEGLPTFYRFYQENYNFGRGLKVWASQFLPWVEKYIESRDVSLDIGYGIGSIVYAASKYFKVAQGVDVILQNDEVGRELDRLDCINYNLLVGDGMTIPLMDDTIDFIHSWTVFMHLGKVEVVKSYLAESYRVLKSGGVAALYFARMGRSKPNETQAEWEMSIQNEPEPYVEMIKPVNHVNLLLSMEWMTKASKEAGLEVVDRWASTMPINGILYFHGQHVLVLRKP